jgi:tetratricopeptide (TPR) repeat protein
MSQIKVNLSDLESYGDVNSATDSIEQINSKVKRLYHFLPQPIKVVIDGDIVTINFKDITSSASVEAKRLAKKASDLAVRGNYSSAIDIYKRVINLNPAWGQVRRELAMIYSETNKISNALDHLIEAIRIDPSDHWSLVVLANLFLTKKNDSKSAEKMLRKALLINPDDSWALNSLAYILNGRENYQESETLYLKSITMNPDFPNSYLGLGKLYSDQKEFTKAEKTLEQMFNTAKIQDVRSEAVFEQARSFYLTLKKNDCEEEFNKAKDRIENFEQELIQRSGYEIHNEKVNFSNGIAGKIKMAWRYNEKFHTLQTRSGYDELLLCHIKTHELLHLDMEIKARARNANKYFSTSRNTLNKAIEDLGRGDLNQRLSVLSKSERESFFETIVSGTCNFLFNCPLDLLIETRIRKDFPEIHSFQFASINNLMNEAISTLSNKMVADVTPKKVYNASLVLNGLQSIFYDRLFGGATNFSKYFENKSTFAQSNYLLRIMDDNKDLLPGEEYNLVDKFADYLGLKNWYLWTTDITNENEKVENEVSEPELDDFVDHDENDRLLKQKGPAAVFYFLDAFKVFESLPIEKIKQIGMEIAVIGMNGLDFSSPEKKYNLHTIPNKEFSGLHLMCYMYASYKIFAPELDTGIALEEAYEQAKLMFDMR